ncbi:MAG TPA: SPOR domain-containing protein [Phycisphaerales bacterium]|nr:SPOR domain-containing protein [Phycisphaerales bacterium]
MTLAAAALGTAGCASSPEGPGGYVSLYREGQYAKARKGAEAALKHGNEQERARAALTAGLAAHAQGDLAAAEAHLRPLLSCPDPAVAGRAGATLGLIAADRGNNQQAAELLAAASGKLTGDDAARAGMQAGDSLSRLSRFPAARAQYLVAGASAKDPALKTALSQRASATDRPSSPIPTEAGSAFAPAGPYAVQLGVFSRRENADRQVGKTRPVVSRLGLTNPRVIPRASQTGGSEYVVLVGGFPSKQAALAARDRLGSGVVVAP